MESDRELLSPSLGRAGNEADGHTLLANQQPRCTVAYCVPRKVLCILQPECYLARNEPASSLSHQ